MRLGHGQAGKRHLLLRSGELGLPQVAYALGQYVGEGGVHRHLGESSLVLGRQCLGLHGCLPRGAGAETGQLYPRCIHGEYSRPVVQAGILWGWGAARHVRRTVLSSIKTAGARGGLLGGTRSFRAGRPVTPRPVPSPYAAAGGVPRAGRTGPSSSSTPASAARCSSASKARSAPFGSTPSGYGERPVASSKDSRQPLATSADQIRDPQVEGPLAEAVLPGADQQRTVGLRGQPQVRGQVLVRTEVVQHAGPLGAVHHRGVEAARTARQGEGPDEGDGLPAVGVGVRHVDLGERNVAAGPRHQDVGDGAPSARNGRSLTPGRARSVDGPAPHARLAVLQPDREAAPASR
ncbi:hypothetical protein SBADM41S_08765 [Streptomyces badius]